MQTITKKTDATLKTDVLAELNYEPSVKVTDIGVLVKDGTVTLNGYATSYGEKWEAVRAVKRVAGVLAIADDIEVKLPSSLKCDDGDIATAAAHQIEVGTSIPAGIVQVTVRNGWITLEGCVEWQYQKDAARQVVQPLEGVKGVANVIEIAPKLKASELETNIQSAVGRNAVLDAKYIRVETEGNKVILRGDVRNYQEREEAERVAWAAPGVLSVANHLEVKWPYFGE
jgi:osmotically-inducible protein OsmY